MREALAVIGEDGLENLWEKHTRLHHELWAGLKEMGLEPFVENPAERLTTVNCIKARARRRSRGGSCVLPIVVFPPHSLFEKSCKTTSLNLFSEALHTAAQRARASRLHNPVGLDTQSRMTDAHGHRAGAHGGEAGRPLTMGAVCAAAGAGGR